MLDPLLTDVLRRRILASVIDLLGIGLVTGLVGWSQAEVFTPDSFDPTTGEAIWSSADQARLTDIYNNLWNRMQEVGGSQYVWTSEPAKVVGFVGLLATLVVFVFVPLLTQSTPGQKLFGLRISDLQGKSASLLQLLIRTLVGVIDLLPVVIPGLLGWLLAKANPQKQRLGDRLAGTTVIDTHGPVRLLSDKELSQRSSQPAEADESMVDLGSRLGQSSASVSATAAASQATDETDSLDLAQAPPETDGITPESPPETDSITPESPPDLAPDVQMPAVEIPAVEPVKQEHLAEGPSEPIVETPAATSLSPVEESLDAASLDSLLPPPPLHRSGEWEAPTAEAAPIWIPEPETTEPETTETEATTLDAATAAEPHWSEEWQAWIFWDDEHQQWLLHDIESDLWVPIS